MQSYWKNEARNLVIQDAAVDRIHEGWFGP